LGLLGGSRDWRRREHESPKNPQESVVCMRATLKDQVRKFVSRLPKWESALDLLRLRV
jgi:hypothetical protein